MSRRGDPDRLEQGAHRELANATIQVVDAGVPKVETMDDHTGVCSEFEPPGLSIVDARSPAREVEDRFQRRSGQRRAAADSFHTFGLVRFHPGALTAIGSAK